MYKLTRNQTSGVEKIHNVLPSANDYEKKLLDEAIKGLKTNIKAGVEFATGGAK